MVKKNYCQEISEIAQYGHTGYSSKMPNLVTLVIRQKIVKSGHTGNSSKIAANLSSKTSLVICRNR